MCKPDVIITPFHNTDGLSVLIKYYDKYTRHCIDQQLQDCIKEAVKSAFYENKEFRDKVTSAIEATIPAIVVETISNVIRDEFKKGTNENII